MNITELERNSLDTFKEGMDCPNEGWLHEMLPETKQTSGIISSLTKKGLITCHCEEGAYWVIVTEKGKTI